MRLSILIFLGVLSVLGQVHGDALQEESVKSPLSLKAVYLASAFAGDRKLVAGERGHILYSDDGGLTWSQAEVPVRVTITSMHFISPFLGWAVGHDTVVLQSRDGGKTWSKQLDGNEANQIVYAHAKQRLEELKSDMESHEGESSDSISMQYENSLIALEEAERDLDIGPNKALMDVWFANENNGIVVGSSGYILYTENGGETWESGIARIENPDMLHLHALAKAKEGSLILIGEAGTMYRSHNNGRDWETLSSPYVGSLFGITATHRSQELYVFGMSGRVYRTLDNGDTWESITTNSRSILQGGHLTDDNRVIIGGLGGVVIEQQFAGGEFVQRSTLNRSAINAVLPREDGGLVIAGNSGVQIINAEGKTQSAQLSTNKSTLKAYVASAQ